MVTYIATILAQLGHENDVTRFYQDLEPLMREARGYRGRHVYRAQNGVAAAAMMKVASSEELKRHAEHPPKGTQFIMVEQWDSVEDRIAFSRSASAGRAKELFPHILPEHSHEFYEDVAPK